MSALKKINTEAQETSNPNTKKQKKYLCECRLYW